MLSVYWDRLVTPVSAYGGGTDTGVVSAARRTGPTKDMSRGSPFNCRGGGGAGVFFQINIFRL